MDVKVYNAADVGIEITVTETIEKTTRIIPAMYIPAHKTEVIRINPDYDYTIGINVVD